jgi:hypothetical protein
MLHRQFWAIQQQHAGWVMCTLRVEVRSLTCDCQYVIKVCHTVPRLYLGDDLHSLAPSLVKHLANEPDSSGSRILFSQVTQPSTAVLQGNSKSA